MRQLFEPLEHGFIHTAADRVAPFDSRQTIDPEAWTVGHIAGVTEQDFSFEECALRQRRSSSLRAVRDSMGEWIAVAAKEVPGNYLLFTDVHGYGSLFYSLIPGLGLVFAETFQGVLGALEARRVERTVDWTTYIAALTSTDQQLQGAFTNRSMASRVHLLGRSQALIVTPDDSHLINRNALGGSLEALDFSAALDTGIEHATSMVTRLSKQGMLNTLHLSGGVDSRLCLALVAAAGVSDRFQLRTADPRKWKHAETQDGIRRDAEIADTIRAKFGLRWAEPQPHAKVSVSFEESIALKSMYRSSFLYELNGSNQHGMANQRVAAVRGGGGELLRATEGSQRLHRQYEMARETDPKLDPTSWRSRRISRSSYAVPDLVRYLGTAVRSSYRGVRSDSSLAGFEQHYMNYRNRTHFGHLRSSLMGNELVVHILSNPWLLRAAQLTPIDSRIRGDVVSELFRRSTPDLLELPFENDVWTSRLTDGTVSVPPARWQASFDASPKRRDDFFLTGHEHGARNMAWDFNVKTETANLINNHFRRLNEEAPTEIRGPIMEQHAQLSLEIEAGRLPSSKILAASSSAVDAISPQRASVLVAELGSDCSTYAHWTVDAACIGEPATIWSAR